MRCVNAIPCVDRKPSNEQIPLRRRFNKFEQSHKKVKNKLLLKINTTDELPAAELQITRLTKLVPVAIESVEHQRNVSILNR